MDVVGPPDLSDYEKERGKPTPSLNHAFVQGRLLAAFLRFPEFVVHPELTLGFSDHHHLTPDLAIYPRLTPDWLHDEYPMLTMPRAVVEILSPNQGFSDVTEKLGVYFAHGVESVWVVQPGLQNLSVYPPGHPRPLGFFQGEARDPATGLTARVEDIFA